MRFTFLRKLPTCQCRNSVRVSSFRFTGVLALFLLTAAPGFGQHQFHAPTDYLKGKFYFYWGWNIDKHSQSDISFRGSDYNFTLDNVVAHDRQTKFNFDTYFNPMKLSTPQYNFRVGYGIKSNWDISIGIDHMKYVMTTDQMSTSTGYIHNSGTPYDGDYVHQDIKLTEEFLQFEHTDGLNYANLEIRRFENIFTSKFVSLNFTAGVGAGLLVPKSNVVLLNNPRHDEFHLAGYGLAAIVGININFPRNFFIQTEMKGGFINMPDIRTTYDPADKASQHFFFMQNNVVFGKVLDFSKKAKNKD